MWKDLSEAFEGFPFLEGKLICVSTYENLCRMSCEKFDAGHVAILCTVFGISMNALICDEDEFPELYARMKEELAEIFERESSPQQRKNEIFEFFARHTTTKTYKEKLTRGR